MKKITIMICMTFLVIMVLAGCGNGNADETKKTDSGIDEKKSVLSNGTIDVSECFTLEYTGGSTSVLDNYISARLVLDERCLMDEISPSASSLSELGFQLDNYADISYAINDGEKEESVLYQGLYGREIGGLASTDVVHVTVTFREDEPTRNSLKVFEDKYSVKFNTDQKTTDISVADILNKNSFEVQVRQPVYIDIFEKLDEMGAIVLEDDSVFNDGKVSLKLERSLLRDFEYEGYTFKSSTDFNLSAPFVIYKDGEEIGSIFIFFYDEPYNKMGRAETGSRYVASGSSIIICISKSPLDTIYYENEERYRLGDSDIIFQPVHKAIVANAP